MNLADVQRRAAELQERLDAARDERTGRPIADELHKLMDSVDNVRELRPVRPA